MFYKYGTSLVAQTVKRLSTMQETGLQCLGWEDLLEKEMATCSSTLAWKIPWMEEPGRLQSMGSKRVGHDWASSLSNIYVFLMLLIVSSLRVLSQTNSFILKKIPVKLIGTTEVKWKGRFKKQLKLFVVDTDWEKQRKSLEIAHRWWRRVSGL